MSGLDKIAARFDICCPLCNYKDPDSYILLLHIEQMHPEHSESIAKAAEKSYSDAYAFSSNTPDYPPAPPLNLNSNESHFPGAYNLQAAVDSQGPEYIMCDVEGCEEPVLLTEMDSHMDLHYAERLALTDVLDESASGSSGGGSFEPAAAAPTANSKRPRAASDIETENRLVLANGKAKKRRAPQRGKEPEKRESLFSMGLTTAKKSVALQSAVGRKPPGKLGKSELGPYADEKEMPKKLLEMCAEGGKVIWRDKIGTDGKIIKVQSIQNETENLIPTMSYLCEADPAVAQAWLCHPSVKHVGKQGAGREVFCGYRNIQMLISYIQAMYPADSHPFRGRIPTILKIQDLIEEGWDRNINPTGRIETGGIKNTRKFIGTSEAQTLFTRVRIPCQPVPFHKSNELNTQLNLLNFVEEYFKSAVPPGTKPAKVYVTNKPPIYFQQPGHSMTIVGIERTRDGWQNLLVFDPVFEPSGAIKELEGAKYINSSVNAAAVLKAYRRGMAHLRKFPEFEILTIEPPLAPKSQGTPSSSSSKLSRSGSSRTTGSTSRRRY